MGIVDEDVAAVRAASDIVAIVSQYTQLRKVGRRFQGRCPFHDERTPSFSVNAVDGLYYCFGCQAKGDVFTFVQEVEHVDFPDAVERLAAKLGKTLRYTDRNENEGRKRKARLVETMAKAVDWYHERLLSGPDAGAARRYLRERGLDGDVVREFQIGWAPDAWDQLCQALRLDARTAEETGLGRVNSRGRLQDHFRARIMFPIFDDQGRPISFGGRILPGGERPGNQGKYQNTTETPLYNKSKVLYGLDRAKRSMVSADTAVVCEGYTDVIGFHRSGVPLAVAACGTALTEDHVRLLRRFASRFVLAFDADNAGRAAAERFYRWEREHGVEVVVADLPPGQDPAEVAQTAPERLQAAVDGARPFLRFRLDQVFAAGDLSTPEGRARVAEAALDVVAEHPDVLVRDQYLLDVGSRCRIEPEQLRARVERVRARPGRTRSQPAATRSRPPGAGPRPAADGQPPFDTATGPVAPARSAGPAGAAHAASGAAGSPGAGAPRAGSPGRSPAARSTRQGPATGPGRRPSTAGPALEVLRHAVHDPAAVAQWLDAVLFDDATHAGVYRALVEFDTHAEALGAAPPPVADLLARLAVEEPVGAPLDALRRLFTEVARRELRLRRLTSVTSDDPTVALTEAAFLVNAINALRNPAATIEVADRLLAWLRQRVGDGG